MIVIWPSSTDSLKNVHVGNGLQHCKYPICMERFHLLSIGIAPGTRPHGLHRNTL